MLIAAKHLCAQRGRPFAAAQGDMVDGYGVTLARCESVTARSSSFEPCLRRGKADGKCKASCFVFISRIATKTGVRMVKFVVIGVGMVLKEGFTGV
jgi:hypothetical protein